MKKNVHITHRVSGSWAVVGEGNSRASGLYDTQAEAIKVGREIAINNKSELVIHDRKNVIRDKDSYGNDPRSIHDTRH